MLETGLFHYVVLACLLFVMGIIGILINHRNILVVLMSIELMLLAVNLNFVAFSAFFGNVTGHIFCLFALVVAGAEVAVGLSILVAFFRLKGTASVESRTWSREGDEM